MNRFPHLSQRLFNRPVAIHPDKAEVVIAALSDRLGVTHLFHADGRQVAMFSPALDDDWSETPDGYDNVGGIAVIPIEGTLVQRTGTLRPYSGMTGYDGIRQNFLTALGDPEISAIVFDIDSPGGEVPGCFDLVDEIYAARGEKPIWAILNEGAYSAAYAIASAADRIAVPRTGGVGSIGVVCMHVDFSKALTGAGIAVTIIQYGDRKADGWSEKPLSDEAHARFQADIDEMGDLFVETVARNRDLPAAKVRDTQAATFLARAGVDLRLADAVMAPDAAFRELVGRIG